MAVFAILPSGTDVGRYAWPEQRILHERSSSIRPGGQRVGCSVPHREVRAVR